MRLHLRRFASLLVMFGALTVSTERASAQIVNGNFETGNLTGWGVVAGSQTLVTTAPTAPFAAYSNGTNQAVLSAGTALTSTIATALTAGNTLGYSFTAPQFDALTSPDLAGDGSVIFQQFNGAGTFSFNWGFANAEGTANDFHDTLFAFVDGTFFDLRDANFDADDASYQNFSLNLGAGDHFIVVGVLNAQDAIADSRGMFDNFTIAAVPEPGSIALMAGLGLAVAYRPIARRIKKRFGKR